MSRLGIIIVNYNSTDYLEKCLASIYEHHRDADFRVAVVDNASEVQEFGHLSHYPSLEFILNRRNLGFATACNQGIRLLETDFFLLLNPDCVIAEETIRECLDFIRDRSEIGILGCRVNNPDGTLQLACRRKIPSPSSAFYRFSGLSTLFPRSKKFGAYNMSFIDDDQPHEVEAVSGSFLLMRKEVIESAGPLDEDFFLYGEDLDLCYRAHLAGWKVFYYPAAHVTHYKRASSSRAVKKANFHFYDAMRIFYEKHFAPQASFLERWLVKIGIQLLYQGRRIRNFLGARQVGSRY